MLSFCCFCVIGFYFLKMICRGCHSFLIVINFFRDGCWVYCRPFLRVRVAVMGVVFFKNGKIMSLVLVHFGVFLPNFVSFLLLRFSEKIVLLLLYPRREKHDCQEYLAFFCRAPYGFRFSEEQRFCEANKVFVFFVKIH